MNQPLFHDRTHAGQQLAASITAAQPNLINNPNVKVFGLARGGIPVAAQVAKALNAPLDTIVVRKLGMPGHEEYAFGAIAPNGCRYLDTQLIQRTVLLPQQINAVISEQQQILETREAKYRSGLAPINMHNATVIIVDDGIATGATMQAAVQYANQQKAAQIIVAVPVGPADTHTIFTSPTQVICPNVVQDFAAVGQFYQEFESVSDEECIELLNA